MVTKITMAKKTEAWRCTKMVLKATTDAIVVPKRANVVFTATLTRLTKDVRQLTALLTKAQLTTASSIPSIPLTLLPRPRDTQLVLQFMDQLMLLLTQVISPIKQVPSLVT